MMIKRCAPVITYVFSIIICTNAVLQLDASNFYSTINYQPFSIVMFYAPWCHHCHDLMPEFERAEISLNQEGIYGIYKFDCDGARTFCNALNIPGFPMVKIFNYGKLVDTYEGQRKAGKFIMG
ncbi:hypothetical protein HZS_4160 [Henneguya salminicola]|nr:hypothetical protein HZS_4160 [Henneguya salminicola]